MHLRRFVFLMLFASFPGCTLIAQSDGCSGALDALNRIKEQIVPVMALPAQAANQHWLVMQSTLERATRVCRDNPELWYYRMRISQQVGDTSDYEYAKSHLADLNFQASYDPLSPLVQPQSQPQSQPQPQSPQSQPSPAPDQTPRQKWALVIGINQFNDPHAPRLTYAVKDSRDFVQYLVNPKLGDFQPDHVLHLEDTDATLNNIRRDLGILRSKIHGNDLVVIYIASHGSPRQSDPNGVSYILTHDSDLTDSASLYATSLQMIDLVQILNRELRAKSVILFLDTCYSGDALDADASSHSRGLVAEPSDSNPDSNTDSTSPPVSFSGALQSLVVGHGRAVLTASRANESSWESSKIQNGYFTHYLIQAMTADGQSATLQDVFPQVQKQVAQQVFINQHANQDPTYEFGDDARSIQINLPAH